MRRLLALAAVVAAVWIPGFTADIPGYRSSGVPDEEGWFRWSGEVRPDRSADEPEAVLPVTVEVSPGTGEVVVEVEGPFAPGSGRVESRWQERIELRRDGDRPLSSGRTEGDRTGLSIDESAGRVAGRSTAILMARGPARHGEACRLGVRVQAEIRLRWSAEGLPYRLRILATALRSKTPRISLADGG